MVEQIIAGVEAQKKPSLEVNAGALGVPSIPFVSVADDLHDKLHLRSSD